MEGTHILRDLLRAGDWMTKVRILVLHDQCQFMRRKCRAEDGDGWMKKRK